MAARGETFGGIGRQVGIGASQVGSALSQALNTAKGLIEETKAKNITAPEAKQQQAPDLSGFEQRFNTAPQKSERDLMMEALGIPADKTPAPTNFGIASDMSFVDAGQRPRTSAGRPPTNIGSLVSPNIGVPIGEGKLTVGVNPFNQSGKAQFTIPTQDLGLGALGNFFGNILGN